MWEQTDEFQFVKKIDDNEFKVIETVSFPDGHFEYGVFYFDFSDYNKEELSKQVRGYYDSLEEVQEIYGSDWKQIVAEILAENESGDSGTTDNVFSSEEELKKNLFYEHGIVVK